MIKQLVPRLLRRQLRQVAWSAQRAFAVARRRGYGTALDFVVAEPWLALSLACGRIGTGATYELSLRNAAPVHCRPYSSDLEVFWDVLVRGHFDWLTPSQAPRRVIDCGANIGTATLAILERWPAATVLAVEPDADNFRMLVRNTAHLGSQVVPLRAGLWSSRGSLMFDSRPFRDGRQWSIHMRAPEGRRSGAR